MASRNLSGSGWRSGPGEACRARMSVPTRKGTAAFGQGPSEDADRMAPAAHPPPRSGTLPRIRYGLDGLNVFLADFQPVRHRLACNPALARRDPPRGPGRQRLELPEAPRPGHAAGAAALPCGADPPALLGRRESRPSVPRAEAIPVCLGTGDVGVELVLRGVVRLRLPGLFRAEGRPVGRAGRSIRRAEPTGASRERAQDQRIEPTHEETPETQSVDYCRPMQCVTRSPRVPSLMCRARGRLRSRADRSCHGRHLCNWRRVSRRSRHEDFIPIVPLV